MPRKISEREEERGRGEGNGPSLTDRTTTMERDGVDGSGKI